MEDTGFSDFGGKGSRPKFVEVSRALRSNTQRPILFSNTISLERYTTTTTLRSEIVFVSFIVQFEFKTYQQARSFYRFFDESDRGYTDFRTLTRS